MDINETKFHLVLRQDEWFGNSSEGSPPGHNLSWDSSTHALRLTPRLFRFPTPADSPPLTSNERRGAAMDRYNNWFWISAARTEIRTRSLLQRQAEHFWDAGDLRRYCKDVYEAGAPGEFHPVVQPQRPGPLFFSGLAVTSLHYLAVGVLDPAGLLIFDLHAGGPPTQLLWPSHVPFVPFDMAPAADGGLWILDPNNSRAWKLDRYFRPRGEGTPLPIEPFHAVSIEAAPDGSILIMASEPGDPDAYSIIYRCLWDGAGNSPVFRSLSLEEPVLRQDMVEPSSPPSRLKGHDMAFVSSGAAPGNAELTGTLYIAEAAGNQTYAFRLQADGLKLSLELLPVYYPMRFYTGKALAAAVESVYYDMDERWLSLTEMPRPRFQEEGVLTLPVFDGGELDCTWGRLFLDAYIPPGTRVRVESYASNQKGDIPAEKEWNEEPRPYCRAGGAELPYYKSFPAEDRLPEGKGSWELLLQRAGGRYLHLRLTIAGPGNMTPYLYALRVYYPRFSYLQQYLPAVYRDINQYPPEYLNETGKEDNFSPFLERFLANMEGFYTVWEGRIAQAQALFDVDITAREFLDWLAGWFGVILDPSWDERRRRLFLRHAVALFNQRGTPSGLIRAIRLVIDPCPDDTLFAENVTECCDLPAQGFSVRIVESFLTRQHPGVVYGDPTAAADPIMPGFSVRGEPWIPGMGAESLHRWYRDYLKQKYPDGIDSLNRAWARNDSTKYSSFDQVLLPPVRPAGASETEVKDWRQFLASGTGFTYTPVEPAGIDPSHRLAYQKFLARRYQRVDRLNSAYGWSSAADKVISFDAVSLPEVFPAAGQPLADWIQFVSQVLSIKEKAHRFTVLVPMDPGMAAEARQQRLDQVKRIVQLEKPAHSYGEVKPYWALFRVGEARLGLDTVPGMGSRYTALILGKNTLAGSYLGAGHPWDVTDRRVLGRDEVGQ